MSKFTEYLSLLPKGLANADKVLEGVINQVKMKFDKLPEDEQSEIIRRKLICHQCPLYSLNAQKDDVEYQKLFNKPFEFDKIRNKYCSVCGCPEETRVSSLSSNCGLESYNKDNPNNVQELKWIKYEGS